MSRSPLEFLRHARDEMDYLIERSRELDRDKFLQDATVQRAFVRSLEIIGEAAKNVPDDFRRQYEHIDWRSIAGMRDRLIHAYFGVDYDIVWDVVTNKVPTLKQEFQRIIQSEETS